jgi:hypothetical protein
MNIKKREVVPARLNEAAALQLDLLADPVNAELSSREIAPRGDDRGLYIPGFRAVLPRQGADQPTIGVRTEKRLTGPSCGGEPPDARDYYQHWT